MLKSARNIFSGYSLSIILLTQFEKYSIYATYLEINSDQEKSYDILTNGQREKNHTDYFLRSYCNYYFKFFTDT